MRPCCHQSALGTDRQAEGSRWYQSLCLVSAAAAAGHNARTGHHSPVTSPEHDYTHWQHTWAMYLYRSPLTSDFTWPWLHSHTDNTPEQYTCTGHHSPVTSPEHDYTHWQHTWAIYLYRYIAGIQVQVLISDFTWPWLHSLTTPEHDYIHTLTTHLSNIPVQVTTHQWLHLTTITHTLITYLSSIPV